jgi:N6-adenosine-specific RNA methylase IME4
MNLPYLLLTDDDLRQLPIPSLQPDWGILALWVTGRAMELARELFGIWGYRRFDEVGRAKGIGWWKDEYEARLKRVRHGWHDRSFG